MKTINEKILNYLQKGKSITPIEALEKFKCFRLSARIWDLRQEGHIIDSETRRKNGKHFSSYKLRS
jgi:hypothetical protein